MCDHDEILNHFIALCNTEPEPDTEQLVRFFNNDEYGPGAIIDMAGTVHAGPVALAKFFKQASTPIWGICTRMTRLEAPGSKNISAAYEIMLRPALLLQITLDKSNKILVLKMVEPGVIETIISGITAGVFALIKYVSK